MNPVVDALNVVNPPQFPSQSTNVTGKVEFAFVFGFVMNCVLVEDVQFVVISGLTVKKEE